MTSSAINVARSEEIQGWMTTHELEWLAAQAQQSSFIAELGAWKGRSTAALVDHTPGIVYTIDNWEGGIDPADVLVQEIKARGAEAVRDEFCNKFAKDLESKKLRLVEMDTVAGVKYLQELGVRFDFIFIDGEHSYNRVRKDISGCLKMLAPKGLLSGHDFGFDGVYRAVTERFPQVQRPVDSIWAVRV
jgi:predicted O-methyltransferase YrrM